MAPRRRGPIARAALLALALAVGVWLAIGLRSARYEAQADRIGGSGQLDEARFSEARDLYRRARAGNPGTDPERVEGLLLIVGGRPREAARVLREVVRREPQNSHAWSLLGTAAERFDPALARRARARVRALRPDPGG
jgi:predicted Zn-dependent protease